MIVTLIIRFDIKRVLITDEHYYRHICYLEDAEIELEKLKQILLESALTEDDKTDDNVDAVRVDSEN